MIPDYINICGVPFAVKLRSDSFNSDTLHLGEVEYTKAEIRINENLEEHMMEQTLIHEWLHGALVMIGRNDLTDDESLVQSLAAAINQTFCLKGEET